MGDSTIKNHQSEISPNANEILKPVALCLIKLGGLLLHLINLNYYLEVQNGSYRC
jgi:hypothetical protein